jgi:uncharacterized protein (DUF1697 family)
MPAAPRTDHTHVLLLRGVNVGGHAKVPMAQLRRFSEEAGASEVTTYLNSGNVLFRMGPDNRGATAVAAAVRAAIDQELGLAVPVVAVSRDELATALELHDALPFRGGEPKLTHLFVLAEPAPAASGRTLEAYDAGPDRCLVSGRFVWVRYGNVSHSSTLGLDRVEKTLGTTATARNLLSVRYLAGRS